jgi:hypothetical protein
MGKKGVDRYFSQINEEFAHAITHQIQIGLSGRGRRPSRLACGAMVVKPGKAATGRHPTFPQGLEAKRPNLAVAGLIGLHKVRIQLQSHRGLQLPRVVVGLGEDFGVAVLADRPPVAHKHEHIQIALDLPHQRRKVIAAVPVEDHDLADPVPTQRSDDVPQHRIQRRLRHMDRHRKVELIAIDPERDRRQANDVGALLPRRLAAPPRQMRGMQKVLALRQMKIVCFDRPRRDHGDLVLALPDPMQVRLRQVPFGNRLLRFGHGIRLQKVDFRRIVTAAPAPNKSVNDRIL